ncbi:hypothetical protein, partial [Halobacillus sp. BBL2006]|uniref:hypothetical protein n=1 Tax=Halobacillus sp. BBL2006 TaxID=1543706 RepID=UPI001E30B51C
MNRENEYWSCYTRRPVNRFPFVFRPFSIQEIKDEKERNGKRQHSRKEKYDSITHVSSPPSLF